ncbi:glycosyltransferase family 4 protein [Bacillus rhizoplanae]|uniref:glycosyltransferase family 4 protein n=1 Tax=Bacillus rhizoplanae TaxID=2880966 RepID=UPI003D2241E0
MNKNKYFLIGPYPPPLGGVSVYIYRSKKMLESMGTQVEVIDFSRMSFYEKLKFLFITSFLSPSHHTFHLDGFKFPLMLMLIFRPFKAQIILHHHSIRRLDNLGKIQRWIASLFVKKIDECIMVGEHLKDGYVKNNLPLPKKITIQSPFVPPPMEDEARIMDTYSHETKEFIAKARPLMVGNASVITFHDGFDLYGLDISIKMVAKLKEKYEDIGLIFAIAEIGDENYFNEMKEKIKLSGLENNIHFISGQKELWPLFKHADLMIRPTYSDGYGISIEEAIYLGCPAVASDVCKRPKGTVLFKNRDLDDFVAKVDDCISKMNEALKENV